jgi:hypothetical protein
MDRVDAARLVLEDPAAPSPSLLPWIALAAGLVILGLTLVWWRRAVRDQLEAAFRMLAREAGLDSAQRVLVRELANQVGAAPAALLVARSALERAAADHPERAAGALGVAARLRAAWGPPPTDRPLPSPP